MIEQKTIDELKAQHGKIHKLKAGDVEVIVRQPSRADWKRFRAATADKSKRADAVENLLRGCCVYPDAEGLDAILGEQPGLSETFGAQVAKIAGAAVKVKTEKL